MYFNRIRHLCGGSQINPNVSQFVVSTPTYDEDAADAKTMSDARDAQLALDKRQQDYFNSMTNAEQTPKLSKSSRDEQSQQVFTGVDYFNPDISKNTITPLVEEAYQNPVISRNPVGSVIKPAIFMKKEDANVASSQSRLLTETKNIEGISPYLNATGQVLKASTDTMLDIGEMFAPELIPFNIMRKTAQGEMTKGDALQTAVDLGLSAIPQGHAAEDIAKAYDYYKTATDIRDIITAPSPIIKDEEQPSEEQPLSEEEKSVIQHINDNKDTIFTGENAQQFSDFVESNQHLFNSDVLNKLKKSKQILETPIQHLQDKRINDASISTPKIFSSPINEMSSQTIEQAIQTPSLNPIMIQPPINKRILTPTLIDSSVVEPPPLVYGDEMIQNLFNYTQPLENSNFNQKYNVVNDTYDTRNKLVKTNRCEGIKNKKKKKECQKKYVKKNIS